MNAHDFYKLKLEHETDAWDLKVALESAQPVVVIDARSRQAYELEHIPGAINLPHREMDQQSLSQLDPARIYVSYCDGIGCNASTKGAAKLSGHGLQVRELLGGLDWWKRDGYATEGSQATPGKELDCGC
ncbi:MAG: Rhodanese-related sulfurtransferase [Paucimonas sp.]|jgi:rhodanese-related sulfurtransferase|nr:Rhodanese-related sulfurtransferase [Paucimonas sp.]